jgi:hypothetical protein
MIYLNMNHKFSNQRTSNASNFVCLVILSIHQFLFISYNITRYNIWEAKHHNMGTTQNQVNLHVLKSQHSIAVHEQFCEYFLKEKLHFVTKSLFLTRNVNIAGV